MRGTEDRRDGSGDFARLKDAGPGGVVQVMVDIGDAVGELDNVASGVVGSGIGEVWLTMPSRASNVRLSPWPSFWR